MPIARRRSTRTRKRSGRKLQQNQLVQYRRRGTLVGAAVTGAGYAWRNRNAIISGVNNTVRVANEFVRKRNSAKRSTAKRSVNMTAGGLSQDTSFGTAVVGRAISDKAALSKMDRYNSSLFQFRYNGVNSYSSPAAFFTLYSTMSSTTGSATKQVPIHLHELFTRGTTTASWQCLRDSTANSYEFAALTGTAADGTTAIAYPFISRKTNSTASSYTPPAMVAKTVKFKFVFKGATSRPSNIYVQLVQILDDNLMPDILGSEERDELLNPIVKRLHYSPLTFNAPGTYRGKQKLRIVKSWYHKIAPDSRDNSDSTGLQAKWNFTWNCNKYCDWRKPNITEQGNLLVSSETTGDSVAIATASTTSLNGTLFDGSKRYFLMVSATDYRTGETVGHEVSQNPSYDMVITTDYVARGYDGS